MTTVIHQAAYDIHNAIKANVDAFYADVIDYDTFSKRNGSLWRRAENEGVDDQVTELCNRSRRNGR